MIGVSGVMQYSFPGMIVQFGSPTVLKISGGVQSTFIYSLCSARLFPNLSKARS